MVVLIIGTGERKNTLLNPYCLLRLTYLSFEVQLGIIAASIPTLKPAYVWFKEHPAVYRGRSRDGQNTYDDTPLYTKTAMSQRGEHWTELGGEDIALPDFPHIRKTTDVDVESDVGHSLGLDLTPKFEAKGEGFRGLGSTSQGGMSQLIGRAF